jgi:hypothetical protein
MVQICQLDTPKAKVCAARAFRVSSKLLEEVGIHSTGDVGVAARNIPLAWGRIYDILQ